MRITHVRVGKLVSGPGYNNTRVEIEAEITDADDDLESVVDRLATMCSTQIARVNGQTDDLPRRLEKLGEDLKKVIGDALDTELPF